MIVLFILCYALMGFAIAILGHVHFHKYHTKREEQLFPFGLTVIGWPVAILVYAVMLLFYSGELIIRSLNGENNA